MRDFHPLVLFLYFAAVIALSMCALHPVYAALSFAGALTACICFKGLRASLRLCAWLLLFVLVMTAFNAGFNHAGLTVLAKPGGNPITLEALVFGLTSGVLLASVILWFSCYQEVVGAAGIRIVFGRILPGTSLIVSMVFAFIPRLSNRATALQDAHTALATGEKGIVRLRWLSTMTSALMGWSMESGLVTAASMKARGYGVRKRSSYRPLRWRRYESLLFAALLLLVTAAVVSLVLGLRGYLFYPYISASGSVWQQLPYALIMVLPLLIQGGDKLRWMLSS